MQKYVNLVDLVKSFPTSIYLQKSASIQPRTSLSKFGGKFNPSFIRLLTLQATHAVGVLGEGLELAGAAFSFSVMVRVQPGEPLGASIDKDTLQITALDESGAIPSLNQSHPSAIQVGAVGVFH